MERKLRFNQVIFGIILLALVQVEVRAQLTPFSIPPRWYFGHRAGMDFTGGGAPVAMAGNVWDGLGGGGEPAYDNQEGATTECFPNGTVAYYSNSCALKDGGHVLRGPNPLLGGGNSSTQGVITIPNPASPTNRYYLVTAAVDGSGGSNCAQSSYGIYVYPVDASVTPIVVGAPTQLLAGQAASAGPTNESITVSSDTRGGYWIVSINYAAGNIRFASWHILNTGAINTTTVYSPVMITGAWAFNPQGTININKCQTRIGYTQHGTSGTGSDYWVYNWDAVNGVATTLVRTGLTGNGFNYGCEFSPDGNVLYTTGLNGGDGLKQIVLATGVVNTVAASDLAPGSIQGWGNLKLGPDNRIYVSHSYSAFEPGPKYLGVINNPNATTVAGANYVATGYNLGAGQYPSTQRGLITLGWHNPNLPIIESSSPSCMSFSYTYNQYYGTAIPVLAGSEEWDFGSGWVTGLGATPSFNFGTNGTYTVKLRLRDQYCQTFYENQKSITVACPAPVELVSFKGKLHHQAVVLSWQTAMEFNNDYFEVQRSLDGAHYETIAKVKGVGNSSQLRSYEYTDATVAGKIVYYRLLQRDFDGATQSSSIVTVYLDKTYASPIAVMPNPFSTSFTLTKLRLEQATISVYDVYGRLVEQKNTTDGEASLELGASLANGSYIVQYLTATESHTLRVEKK